MTEAPSESVIRRVLEEHRGRFNNWDKQGWLDLFVESPQVEEPVGTPVRTGREHFSATMDNLQRAGMQIPEYETVLVCGHEAAVTMTLNVGASALAIIELFRFDDEARIIGTRVFMPPFEQLGL
jgi:hypothetical protein